MEYENKQGYESDANHQVKSPGKKKIEQAREQRAIRYRERSHQNPQARQQALMLDDPSTEMDSEPAQVGAPRNGQ